MAIRMKRFYLMYIGLAVISCTPIKPYEKEYLLEPVMSDDFEAPLTSPTMATEKSQKEKLGAFGSSSGVGSSCPTCGG